MAMADHRKAKMEKRLSHTPKGMCDARLFATREFTSNYRGEYNQCHSEPYF